MRMQDLLLSTLCCFCLTQTVPADCVQLVKHFAESELPDVERSLNVRKVEITARQREMILAEVRVRDPDSKNDVFSAVRAAQNEQSNAISYNAISDLLGSALMCHEFRGHIDVLVRFQANLRLAATSDKKAAEDLCALLIDRSLSSFDARLIRTGCLEYGINPDIVSPKELLDFLASLRRSNGFKKGEEIADFEIADTDGKVFKLSEHRGKFVVIHFWATNCGPCMARMPEIKERIGRFPAERVEALFVSLDYEAEAFAKAKKDLGINCRHVFDGRSVGGSIPRHFRVDRMPLDIVIDPTGRFVANSLNSIDTLLSAEEESRTKR